jgi:hypothetical protein
MFLGKSSSAKMGLYCLGAQNVHFKGSRSTLSAILNTASTTTIPIVYDDVSSQHVMEEMAVQLTGGATCCTVSGGESQPKTSVIVTSNQHFAQSDRNAVRLLLIPFWNIEVDCTDDRSKQEEDLLQACAQASSGVGFCISLGRVIETEDFAQNLHHFVSIVKRQLPILSYRVQRSYALLLALVDEVLLKFYHMHYYSFITDMYTYA